jgi:hypothetical protein
MTKLLSNLVSVIITAIMALLLSIPPAQAQPDAAYLTGVQSMYKQVQANPTSPTNLAFKSVLDQLFTPKAVQIPFRAIDEKSKVTSTPYSGNIYFSQGEIFINYNEDAGGENAGGENADNENFATIENKLYTWKSNATEGTILKRFPGDTLAFVMYMTDPSAIMRSVYINYLEKPQEFTVKSSGNGQKYLQFKTPNQGFNGLKLQENPFWLRGFSFTDKTVTATLEIDPPIALEALPPVLYSLPKGITFKPSADTLKARMTYL